MKWSCAVNLNKDCSGIPDWKEEPIQYTAPDGTPTFTSGGSCKLNPKTCGKCLSIKDQIPSVELERLNKSTYRETIIPISPEEKKEINPKSKAAKKLEQEIAQKRMF